MKNLLVIIFIVGTLLIAGFYFFLPSKIAVDKVIFIKTPLGVTSRFLLDTSEWRKWFPINSSNATLLNNLQKEKYEHNGYLYALEKRMMNTAEITISKKQIFSKSLVNIFSINVDSVAIEWKIDMPESSNFLTRLKNYLEARKIQNSMEDVLIHLKTFLAENKNVYGFDFNTIISKDSTLIVIKDTGIAYPSTAIIYNLILNLKKYASVNGALENNFPMLHVRKIKDSTTFETMVAIPINKYLEGKGKILNKRFVPWKVLTAEVKGGDYTVNEAFKQMALYMNDNQIKGMALPFASLVTERNKQPDTSKWITRIYTPIP